MDKELAAILATVIIVVAMICGSLITAAYLLG